MAILDPTDHPYPNISTAMNTFQSKRLGEYLIDVALAAACDSICAVRSEEHAWVSAIHSQLTIPKVQT